MELLQSEVFREEEPKSKQSNWLGPHTNGNGRLGRRVTSFVVRCPSI